MHSIPQDNAPHKQCSHPECENPSLPATREFFYAAKTKAGLTAQCKQCIKKQANARYQIPEVRQRVQAYSRQPDVKERHRQREHQRGQHLEFKLTKRQYDQEYRQRPEVRERKRIQAREQYRLPGVHERLRAYSNNYYKIYSRRPEQQLRSRINSLTRIARKRSASGTYTVQQIQDLLKRQRRKCYYCSTKFTKQDGRYRYHIDHIVPLARGGTNDISNLVLACPSCNLQKSARMLHEWPEGGRLL